VRLEADPSDFEPPPRPFLKDAGLAFIETHLCHECQRTRDCRTHHADETTGGGRSSAVSRRIYAPLSGASGAIF
jgi:hypothetical protein